jgi:beta-1,4-mannosyl-glycoprotein beta-1,4-N-acetylglucosaminyltransferase
LKLYYYYLNGYACSGWYGARAYTFKTLKENFWFSIDQARRLRSLKLRIGKLFGKEHFTIIKNGGWHFSYLGDEKFIRNKIFSAAHFEKDSPELKDLKKIKEKKDSGINLFEGGLKTNYVPIDDSFPEEIRKNKKKYSKFIKKV